MEFWQAIVLGALQGVAEFLPISSSGHLLLAEKLFGIDGDIMLFNVMLHLSSLIAVFIIFWKDIVVAVKKPICKANGVILLTTCVSLVFAFVIRKFFTDILLGKYLGVCFLITACLLFYTEKLTKNNNGTVIEFTYAQGAMVGVFQGLAVLPGLSRSGFTIASGLILKGERNMVAKYSFLVSIPIILAAGVFECITSIGSSSISALPLIGGMVVCFVCSLLSIKFMLKKISSGAYLPFVIYLVVIGVVSMFV